MFFVFCFLFFVYNILLVLYIHTSNMSIFGESNFNTFARRKTNFEDNVDNFKTTFENYNIGTDSSFVTLNNIDATGFTPVSSYPVNALTENECKSSCLSNNSCIAFSFDSTCKNYKSIRPEVGKSFKLYPGNTNVSFLKNYHNMRKVLEYSKIKNNEIRGIAERILNVFTNNDIISGSPYYYDKDGTDKTNLDTTYEDFKRSQQSKKKLIISNENNIDPTEVNKEYLRYIFLITLMFIFITIFIYFSVNNTINKSNNFMLYLVLFIVVFSVLFIYFLK